MIATATRPKADRKQGIDYTVAQAEKLTGDEAAMAWLRLTANLSYMAEPEARPPRFTALLNAIWNAATNETGP